MKKVAIIYYTGTGNTEQMANEILTGATGTSNHIKTLLIQAYEQYNVVKNGTEVAMEELTDIKDVTESYSLAANVKKIETAKFNGQLVYIFTTNIEEGWNNITCKFVIDKTGLLLNITPEGTINGNTDGKPGNDECLKDNYGVIGSTSDNFAENFEIIAGATGTSINIKKLLPSAYAQFKIINRVPETPLDQLTDILDISNGLELISKTEGDAKLKVISVESAKFEGQSVYIFKANIVQGWNNVTCKIVISKKGVILNITPEGTVNGNTESKPGNDECLKDNYGVIGSTSDTLDENFTPITGATGTSTNIKALIKLAYEQFAKIGGTK